MSIAVRILVVAAVAAAVGVAVRERSSPAATGPATIRITDQQVSLTRVDVGRAGRSPGDTEIVRTLLYNRRITPKAIGHGEFVCTYVVGISRQCRGTIFLPRGKLMVGGPLRFRSFYELAVLGGTGLYDNARGTLTVTRTNTGPSRSILIFRLVG